MLNVTSSWKWRTLEPGYGPQHEYTRTCLTDRMIIEPYNVLKSKLLANGEQSLADEPASISEPNELYTEAPPPWGKRSRGTRHTSGIGSKMRG
jgi:hypothetical protein